MNSGRKLSKIIKSIYLPTHLCKRLQFTGQGISCCMSFFFSWNFSIAGNGLSCFSPGSGCYQFHSEIPSYSVWVLCDTHEWVHYFLTMRTLIYITEGSSFLLPLTQDCCKNLLFKHTIHYLNLQEKGTKKSKATCEFYKK